MATRKRKEADTPNEEEQTSQLWEGEYWEILINEEVAAKFLDLSSRTLQAYRLKGRGPPFYRLSARCIRYRRTDLRTWVQGRHATSTSEYSE